MHSRLVRGLPIASAVEATGTSLLSIDVLLERVVELNASDLHITAGSPPIVRVNGSLLPLDDYPTLSPDATRDLLYRILSTEKQKHLEINRQIDLSYGVPGLARFRMNVYLQRDSVAAAFRTIPADAEDARGARPAAEPERARAQGARPRARHRARPARVSRRRSRR